MHKNLACLPALKRALQARHGLQAEFYVTLTDAEWASCSAEFRQSIHNVGALVLAQCPSFYAALDGVVFPSLLECFSAVPLEAMCMRRPLFASDLPFIRDCCHEHANYFDPLDIDAMAQSVAGWFQTLDEASRLRRLDSARDFLQRYPSPAERAAAYLTAVREAMARRKAGADAAGAWAASNIGDSGKP